MPPQPRKTAKRHLSKRQIIQPASEPFEIDPRWLARAIGLALMAALLCVYLTLGLLFYQGAWQLVLHPTHNPSSAILLAADGQTIRFFGDESGRAQLSGQWLPARDGTVAANYVFLMCRGGDGQLGAGDQASAQLIRNSGASAFFFDYRGFGDSSIATHPSEQSMSTDAEQAWTYLTGTRRIGATRIILAGSGIGAVFASRLAQQHSNAAALVLWNADADAFKRILSDPRSRILPARFLISSRFDLAATLDKVTQPKLLFSVGEPNQAREAAYRDAHPPKNTVALPTTDAAKEKEALARFLDDQLGSAPSATPLSVHTSDNTQATPAKANL